MTMLWPAQNNSLNIFAQSDKSPSVKEAFKSPADTAFRSTLTEANRLRSAQAETAENRRPEASEPPRRAEKPQPAEQKEPPARSADEPAEARETEPNRESDEAAASPDREASAESPQVGEGRSETDQTGDSTSSQGQESAQSTAQQPSAPAQGLQVQQLAGEVGWTGVQPAGATEMQNEQPQVVVLPVEGAGEITGATDSQSASPPDQTTAPAAAPNQTGEFAARTVLESMVAMNDPEAADQNRPAAGDVEPSRPAAASQAQEQVRPADRPATAQPTNTQNQTDQVTQILQDQPASERQASGDDRGSKEDGRQQSQWVMRGDSASASTPAVARAAQVEAGVRLENATAQAPTAELSGRTVAAAMPLGQIRIDSVPAVGQTTGSGDERAAGARNMADAPFTGRVIRGLTAMINQRGGVMNMRLEPPELGDLRVQMTIARGQVSAQFHVSTNEAHAQLEKSMGSLRAALESHGLTVERLHVHLPSSNSSQDMREENAEQDQQQQSRGHTDAGEGQSRGRGEDDETLNHQRSSRPAASPFAEAFASAPHAEERTGQ